MKNIGIIGIGGVGGYFGGKIAKSLENNNEYNVYFIARGKHLHKIRENGLLLKTNSADEIICRPELATDDIDKLPMLDYCFICVKQYDLNNVLLQLKNKVDDNTKIIPLLNGVDIYTRIRSIIKNGIVFPSCVYVGTHIESPGVVCQSGGSCTIIFGKDPKNRDAECDDICRIFDDSSIKYKWTEKNIEEIWSKFMFIASYGLVTAYYNKTLGEIYSNEEYSNVVKKVMNIIYKLSREEKVNLNEDIIKKSYDKADNFPFDTKTSFQRDFENKNKKDERELFGLSIIEMGERHNINTDVVKKLYEGLNIRKEKFWEKYDFCYCKNSVNIK